MVSICFEFEGFTSPFPARDSPDVQTPVKYNAAYRLSGTVSVLQITLVKYNSVYRLSGTKSVLQITLVRYNGAYRLLGMVSILQIIPVRYRHFRHGKLASVYPC